MVVQCIDVFTFHFWMVPDSSGVGKTIFEMLLLQNRPKPFVRDDI